MDDIKTNLTVGKTNDCDFNTIQEALDSAEENSIIQVKSGIYEEHLQFSKKVRLIGCNDTIINKSSNELPIVILDSTKSCEIDVPVEIEGIVFTHKKDLQFDSISAFIKTPLEFGNKESEDFKSLFLVNSESSFTNIAILFAEDYGITFSELKSTLKNSFIHHANSSGIYIAKDAEPTINDCIISDSNIIGIRISDSASPIIKSCNIQKSKNIGIHSDGKSNPKVTFCEIKDSGFGVYIAESSTGMYENCNIHHNTMGMNINDSSFPSVVKCTIYNNEVMGISSNDESKSYIEDCEIFCNLKAGISVGESSNPKIVKCEIYNNEYGLATNGKSNIVVNLCEIHDSDVGVSIAENSKGLYENFLIHSCKSFGFLINGKEHTVIKKSKVFKNPVGIFIQDGILEIKESDICENHNVGIDIRSKLSGIYENCYINSNGIGIEVFSSNKPNFDTCDVKNNSKENISYAVDALKNLLGEIIKKQNEGNLY